MVVSVNCTTQASMKYVAAVRGRGLRSFVKTKPSSVAPPIAMATGNVRANPQASPWGTKYAIQYHARTPTQGLDRLTGTSPRMRETTRRSLMVGARRAGCRARGPLFHRDALGEVA